MRIDDLDEQFAFDVPDDEDYDTVGGFVYAQLGRIPKRREVVAWKQLRVTVLDADKRRILKLRVDNVACPRRVRCSQVFAGWAKAASAAGPPIFGGLKGTVGPRSLRSLGPPYWCVHSNLVGGTGGLSGLSASVLIARSKRAHWAQAASATLNPPFCRRRTTTKSGGSARDFQSLPRCLR